MGSQSEVRYCQKGLVKPFVWYILVVSETFSRDISLWFQKERIRCADQSCTSVHSVRMKVAKQVTASVLNDRISELVLVPINRPPPPNPQHSAAVSSKQLQMISDEKKGAVTKKKTKKHTNCSRGGVC